MKRSKVSGLPAEIRKYLEAILLEKNFSGYEQVVLDVRALGEKLGVPPEDLPSKSAIHRFGSDLERRLQATKAATEAAVALNASAPDDEAQLSGAVLSMIQTDVFNIILKLREADDADPVKRAKLLSAVGKDMATSGRAQIDLKRFKSEVNAKLKTTADAVAKMARKGGMSKALEAEMRNRILGIATT